ncbi:MAG: ExeM/NucH family extracellular endonuclease [Nocardioides sp.]
MSSSRKRIALALGLGLVASGLLATPTPASANPTGTGLVINEVYGGGGNTGAQYTNDFVELYNPTSSPISVAGMSVQYRSATGTTATVTNLAGSVPANGHYLVQQAAGTTPAAALPTPDATGTAAMSGSGGVVLLVPSTTPFTGTGNLAGNPAVLDAVGYGTTPTTFETSNTAVALTNTTSGARTAGADSDQNAPDFSEGAPAPQNSGATPPPPPPPPPGTAKTIAEIQGNATTSPEAGNTVITQGVVTAQYPGSLNGLYIQTAGTGSGADATPGASDGVFVFGSNIDETPFAVGDSVEVTGLVSESFGLTQVTPASGGVTELTAPLAPVTPLAAAYPTTATDRETHESELFAPAGPFTVTNAFGINRFAEIGLASGTTPLIAPTEVEDAQTGNTAAIVADNAARAVVLDDGANVDYTSGANRDVPLPWLSPSNPIRVGAPVTFTGPVVLSFGFGAWRFQPQQQVTGNGAGIATFANTRTSAPGAVGGDLRLATFNVLNYFPTTGAEYVAGGLGTCTYFTDRAGNPITNNTCSNNGPRGAANTENLQRQQDKIVAAINKLDASIVSLEELENSAKFGKDRDFAIGRLVDALNLAAGAGTWAFVASPPAADRPPVADEDVIRTGFIYKPAQAVPVGTSQILIDEVNFDNAREPLAQAFKKPGTPDSSAFVVIVNHFKSKGSGADDGTGQGLANQDRIGQANALSAFADTFAASRGTDQIFLAGDFNAYSQEDPMQVLYAEGYTAIESDTAGEETYSFSGLSGSLDHVLASPTALPMVTGADIWNINSGESIAFQYSRFNYNATNFYQPDAFASSDHDPEIVGIDVAETAAPVDVQILGTNDFHGRILNNTSNGEAGAAVLAGAVKQLRSQNPNTVFAAAGDLIGASTFESFIQNDEPTIDALNEAGLEVSAAGNHEFDQGYADLAGRVQDRADWEYIAANVRKRLDNSRALAPTFTKTLNGVQVGFVGAVTEDLPSLVSPDGIAEIEVTDIVSEVNASADDLEAAGADLIVLLVHEGAPSTDCATMDDDPTSDFGGIIAGVDDNIDAIVSGHTHLEYNCSFPVAEWVAEARPVTDRPVVSAGQYGIALNQLVFTVDPTTGVVTAKKQAVLKLKTSPSTPNYPSDAVVAQIVADAVEFARVAGARKLGKIGGPFKRARLADGTTENRGGESTLGNLVAEIQQSATEAENTGAAQIAFMNPGGLRADIVAPDGIYPSDLTFRQAANVQPFANTLVNMDLTGTQLETVLEEQWQPATESRPFLKLGVSEGFTYTYEPPAAGSPLGTKGEVTGMWLNGQSVADASTYSVTVNSFLASGGDKFTEFTRGTGRQDTGQTDLEATVDYFAANATDAAPLQVDYSQRAVGVRFPATAPEAYAPGDQVTFDLSSLAMTGPGDVTDSLVTVSLGGDELGTFAVNNVAQTALPGFDEAGKATVTVTLPADLPSGDVDLIVTGSATGTTTQVPITVVRAPVPTTVEATADPITFGKPGTVVVKVSGDGSTTGTVVVSKDATTLGQSDVVDGAATVVLPPRSLDPGEHTLTVTFTGANAETATTEVVVQVLKATAVITATNNPDPIVANRKGGRLIVVVSAEGVTPTGIVRITVQGETLVATLDGTGRAVFSLPTFRRTGTETIPVNYVGDDKVNAGTIQHQVRVVRK